MCSSLVLGRVKDFLGVISEASRRLELKAKDNSYKFEIGALTGNESEVIEMDLMLGIADLHAFEAVAAAEAAITGSQPAIPVAESSNQTESKGKSDDDESDNQADAVERDDGASGDFNNGNYGDNKQGFPSKDETLKCGQNGSDKAVRNNRLKKWLKFVEMSRNLFWLAKL